jgi:hypothetical protein
MVSLQCTNKRRGKGKKKKKKNSHKQKKKKKKKITPRSSRPPQHARRERMGHVDRPLARAQGAPRMPGRVRIDPVRVLCTAGPPWLAAARIILVGRRRAASR